MRTRSGLQPLWMRGLIFPILLFVTVLAAAQEPVKVQAARRAFGDAYRHEDWGRAAEIGLELVQMVPRAIEKFNLSCVYARAGDTSSSLHWLNEAAITGFYRLSLMEADPDLEAVRDLAGYTKVRAHVEKNVDHLRTLAIQEASATPPLTVAPKGKDIHGPRPLIIALHGYGDSAKNYPSAWGPAANEIGAILALPEGAMRVGEGRGWVNVELAEAIVMLTLEYAKDNFDVDLDRVILTGFSQGGFMAMAIGLRNPDLFVGVIPMAGGYIPDIDAPQEADEGDPRYYFMVGSHDKAVKPVERAASDFGAAGYEVKLRVLPGTGHAFPRARKKELGKALRFALGE